MHKYIVGAILSLITACAYAAGATPKFSHYPVAHIYKGKHAKVKIYPDDTDVYYRRALVQAGPQPVNFAGHYVIFLYACGSGCITGAILDVVTGDVVDGFPDGYIFGDDPTSFSAEYQANSRLLVISGKSGSDIHASPPVRTNCYILQKKKDELKQIKCE